MMIPKAWKHGLAVAWFGLGASAVLAQVAPPEDGESRRVALDDAERRVLAGLDDQYRLAYARLEVRSSPRAADGRGVTAAHLRRIAPQLSITLARQAVPHLNRTMEEFRIDNRKRMAAFLAQVAHESGGFVHRTELASGAAYEGRKSLGNTRRGDGRRYKGRGYIQLTGRANYRRAGRELGQPFETNPALVARPDNAARVSGWYWDSRKLNALADRGQFAQITKKINGGQNGRRSREMFHARAKRALGS